MRSGKRLIFVSNRLPLTITEGPGGPELKPSSAVWSRLCVPCCTSGKAFGWAGLERTAAPNSLTSWRGPRTKMVASSPSY